MELDYHGLGRTTYPRISPVVNSIVGSFTVSRGNGRPVNIACVTWPSFKSTEPKIRSRESRMMEIIPWARCPRDVGAKMGTVEIDVFCKKANPSEASCIAYGMSKPLCFVRHANNLPISEHLVGPWLPDWPCLHNALASTRLMWTIALHAGPR